VTKIWVNLIRFGQNQNLASLKTLDFLRLWEWWPLRFLWLRHCPDWLKTIVFPVFSTCFVLPF